MFGMCKKKRLKVLAIYCKALMLLENMVNDLKAQRCEIENDRICGG